MVAPALPIQDAVACPVTLLTRAGSAHLDRAVRAGDLLRVTRGVYAPADAWTALAPWERYLARVHAASLRHPHAVFALESAAALLGLPVFGEPRDVHVLAPPDLTARPSGGVRVHTTADAFDSIDVGGLLVTSLEATAVALARARHNATGLAVVNAALRRLPGLDARDLRLYNETRLTSRGRRHARWVFTRACSDTESTLEDVSLAVIEWLGFAQPELQHWLRGQYGDVDDRADFWWPEARVAGEADGDLKYDGRFGDATIALRERRARDARMAGRGARAVIHWSWDDVTHPDRLRAALIAAGLRPIRPEEPLPLRTLRSALTARLH